MLHSGRQEAQIGYSVITPVGRCTWFHAHAQITNPLGLRRVEYGFSAACSRIGCACPKVSHIITSSAALSGLGVCVEGRTGSLPRAQTGD
jgi:hypothetical protein